VPLRNYSLTDTTVASVTTVSLPLHALRSGYLIPTGVVIRGSSWVWNPTFSNSFTASRTTLSWCSFRSAQVLAHVCKMWTMIHRPSRFYILSQLPSFLGRPCQEYTNYSYAPVETSRSPARFAIGCYSSPNHECHESCYIAVGLSHPDCCGGSRMSSMMIDRSVSGPSLSVSSANCRLALY